MRRFHNIIVLLFSFFILESAVSASLEKSKFLAPGSGNNNIPKSPTKNSHKQPLRDPITIDITQEHWRSNIDTLFFELSSHAQTVSEKTLLATLLQLCPLTLRSHGQGTDMQRVQEADWLFEYLFGDGDTHGTAIFFPRLSLKIVQKVLPLFKPHQPDFVCSRLIRYLQLIFGPSNTRLWDDIAQNEFPSGQSVTCQILGNIPDRALLTAWLQLLRSQGLLGKVGPEIPLGLGFLTGLIGIDKELLADLFSIKDLLIINEVEVADSCLFSNNGSTYDMACLEEFADNTPHHVLLLSLLSLMPIKSLNIDLIVGDQLKLYVSAMLQSLLLPLPSSFFNSESSIREEIKLHYLSIIMNFVNTDTELYKSMIRLAVDLRFGIKFIDMYNAHAEFIKFLGAEALLLQDAFAQEFTDTFFHIDTLLANLILGLNLSGSNGSLKMKKAKLMAISSLYPDHTYPRSSDTCRLVAKCVPTWKSLLGDQHSLMDKWYPMVLTNYRYWLNADFRFHPELWRDNSGKLPIPADADWTFFHTESNQDMLLLALKSAYYHDVTFVVLVNLIPNLNHLSVHAFSSFVAFLLQELSYSVKVESNAFQAIGHVVRLFPKAQASVLTLFMQSPLAADLGAWRLFTSLLASFLCSLNDISAIDENSTILLSRIMQAATDNAEISKFLLTTVLKRSHPLALSWQTISKVPFPFLRELLHHIFQYSVCDNEALDLSLRFNPPQLIQLESPVLDVMCAHQIESQHSKIIYGYGSLVHGLAEQSFGHASHFGIPLFDLVAFWQILNPYQFFAHAARATALRYYSRPEEALRIVTDYCMKYNRTAADCLFQALPRYFLLDTNYQVLLERPEMMAIHDLFSKLPLPSTRISLCLSIVGDENK